MEYLLKRIAYLKGLADGYDLDSESKEGKILSELIDVISDMVDELSLIHISEPTRPLF